MNHTGLNNLRILARNEGKIKSYESCGDVRAWSHDVQVRGCYLREWMKSDMPICVIPISTLCTFLRIMTCRNRGKITPRCHPDCKSKVLLESICKSCQAMRECFKGDEHFEKYFEEEEFETGHWPCERCVDALKSIKMFWKIIIEKIFNINISKNQEHNRNNNHYAESVRTVASIWQKEIIDQAQVLKKEKSQSTRGLIINQKPYTDENGNGGKNKSTGILKQHRDEYDCDTNGVLRIRSPKKCVKSYKNQSTCTDCSSTRVNRKMSTQKRMSKGTSVKIKTTDISCNTCEEDATMEDIKTYKANLNHLQQRITTQEDEMDRLQKENKSLKIELQNVYNNCQFKTKSFYLSLYGPENNYDATSIIPKPFECSEEESENNQAMNVDSEMIITLRNCEHQSFKHVSVLQVLHKTNESIPNDLKVDKSSSVEEDPVILLNKVQSTFGAIVKRELNIIKDGSSKNSDIKASFHRVNASSSVPSCSTVSAYSSSVSDFVSARDIRERPQSSCL